MSSPGGDDSQVLSGQYPLVSTLVADPLSGPSAVPAGKNHMDYSILSHIPSDPKHTLSSVTKLAPQLEAHRLSGPSLLSCS